MSAIFGGSFGGLGDSTNLMVSEPAAEDGLANIFTSTGTTDPTDWAGNLLNDLMNDAATPAASTAPAAAQAVAGADSVYARVVGDTVPATNVSVGLDGSLMSTIFDGTATGGGGSPVPTGGTAPTGPKLVDTGTKAGSKIAADNTLEMIAQSYGTTVEAIQKANPNAKNGDWIIVPIYRYEDGSRPPVTATMPVATTGGGGTGTTTGGGGTGTTTGTGGTTQTTPNQTQQLADLNKTLASLKDGTAVSGTPQQQLAALNALLASLQDIKV